MSKFSTRQIGLCAALLLATAGAAAVTAQDLAPAASLPPSPLVQPVRRTPEASPVIVPDLPAAAATLTPVSFDIVIRRRPRTGAAHTTRQRVERTSDWLHVAEPNGTEWFFVQNPVDRRRATGWFVDHAAREIVVYEDSELRHARGLSGWADVVTFGVKPELIQEMVRTPGQRVSAGIQFTRYVATDTSAATREVWWSHEQLLPAAFVTSDAAATVEFTIEHVAITGQPKRTTAVSRYPDYRVIGYADRLERH